MIVEKSWLAKDNNDAIDNPSDRRERINFRGEVGKMKALSRYLSSAAKNQLPVVESSQELYSRNTRSHAKSEHFKRNGR